VTLANDLRAVRRELMEQLLQIGSAQGLFEFQVELAKHIQTSEQAAGRSNTDVHKAHIHRLRSLGDGLAWMLLHPHTIRQLANNPSAPPSLMSQAQAFQGTLEAAAEYAETGVPVLVCDITNHLRIGDLVLCFHPELPGLVECKTRIVPQTLMRGRSGRQVSRMMGTLEYLKTGTAKLFGESEPRLTIQVDAQADHSFEAVDTAVREALRGGVGVAAQSDRDVVWAIADHENESLVPPQVRHLRRQFKTPCIACHARALEDHNALVAPPVSWPIQPNARFALMETDLLLFHLVDVARFAEVVTQYGRVARITSVLTGSDEYEHTFIVEASGQYHTFTSNPLWDVLYGFQTIESAVLIMTEAASRMNNAEVLDAHESRDKSARPQFVLVRSTEEARRLSLHASSIPEQDMIIGMPYELFHRLIQSARRSRPQEVRH
jgi:hypothetical protein